MPRRRNSTASACRCQQIVEVCEEMGCWIALGSDKEFQTIRFKVEDGVIVFPMWAKGLNATVEGVLDVATLSVDGRIRSRPHRRWPKR